MVGPAILCAMREACSTPPQSSHFHKARAHRRSATGDAAMRTLADFGPLEGPAVMSA